MKFFALAACLGLMLSLTGCNRSTGYTPKKTDQVPDLVLKPGDEKDIFPAVAGNQWIYEADITTITSQGLTSSVRKEVTLRITDVADSATGKAVTMEFLVGGEHVDSQVWELREDGIFQVSTTDKRLPFSPALPILQFPLTELKKFEWKGTGPLPAPAGAQGEMRTELQNMGIETCTTLNKDIKALRTEAHTFWSIPVKVTPPSGGTTGETTGSTTGETAGTTGTTAATTGGTTGTTAETSGGTTGTTSSAPKAVQGESGSVAWWVPKTGFVRLIQEVALEGGGRQITKMSLKSSTLK